MGRGPPGATRGSRGDNPPLAQYGRRSDAVATPITMATEPVRPVCFMRAIEATVPSCKLRDMNAQRLTLVTVAVVILAVAVLIIVPRLGGSANTKTTAAIDLAGHPVAGADDAPVTMVFFEDFLCSHCAEFSENIYPLLERDYVSTGKAKASFFNFPVVDPVQSRVLGGVMACVTRQDNDAFWTLEPILMRAQRELVNTSRALELATTYAPGLDGAALKSCVDDGTGLAVVDADTQLAQRLGLTGTPSVLVNGVLVANPSYANVKAAIDAALAKAG